LTTAKIPIADVMAKKTANQFPKPRSEMSSPSLK
jgi:hypothetical protein